VAQALKEFARILKPGGGIMFTEPNMMNPQIALVKNIPAVTVLPTHIVFDNRLRYDSAVGGKCRHGSLKI